MRALRANEELVRSQHGADLAILRQDHAPRAAIRDSEDGEWRPATYEDLLDFILGKRTPAEEPREVVEPKSAVGLAVEELRRREVVEPKSAVGLAVEDLRRREVVEPAPAPAQRLTCKECCQDIPASEVYAGTHFRPDPRTGGRWPCGPVVFAAPEPPAPARWRCEGCGAIIHDSDPWREVNTGVRVHYPDPSTFPLGKCGPVVPVGEAGS